MASQTGLAETIADITKCSICLKTLSEPKQLPCIHTFCLQCLQTLSQENKSEEKISCPVCRKRCSIPIGGMEKLTTNFFMIQLIEVNQLEYGKDTDNKSIKCELCSELDRQAVATSFCLECNQHFCGQCALVHNKLKMSKTHEIVHAKDIPRVEERIKMAISYCELHPRDELKLYCNDCKVVTCVMCYVEHHNKHERSDIKNCAMKFSEQLREDTENIVKCTSEGRKRLKEVEANKKELIKKFNSTGSEIVKRYNKLIAVMKSHRSQLLKELDLLEEKTLKEIETRKKDVERHIMIMENFTRYCQKLMENGTACNISRSANDLHVRAEELKKTHEQEGDVELVQIGYTLMPVPETIKIVKNFIGNFVLNDQTMKKKIDKLRDIAAKKNSDDSATKKHNESLAAKNNNEDLMAKKSNEDLTEKKSNEDLTAKKSNEDLTEKKSNEDLTTKKSNEDLTATRNNDDLEAQNKNNDLAVQKDNEDFAAEKIKDDLTMLLYKPKIHRVMPMAGLVHGITVLGTELYVIQNRNSATEGTVDIYCAKGFTLKRNIKILGSMSLQAIASCHHNNCLYLSDALHDTIYRYDVSKEFVKYLNITEASWGLSVTKECFNLLITLHMAREIHKYSSNGIFLRKISLDSSMHCLHHCVHLKGDEFAVSYGDIGKNKCGVVVIDSSGCIIRSYGGRPGTEIGQMGKPCHLSVDSHGNILVVDAVNSRIEQLTSTMLHVGYTELTTITPNYAQTLYVDEINNAFYTGQGSNIGWYFLN